MTVFHAAECHLCDRAIVVVREAQAIRPFELELVDIGGDIELESAYRTSIPVVEIDGVRAFTYFVSVDSLVARLESRGSDDGRPVGSSDARDRPAGNM